MRSVLSSAWWWFDFGVGVEGQQSAGRDAGQSKERRATADGMCNVDDFY